MPDIVFEVRVAIWAVLALLATLLLAYLFFGSRIKRIIYRKNPKRYFDGKVASIVRKLDLYLINDFKIEGDSKVKCQFDYIIGGDKFLYMVNVCYFEGMLGAYSKSPTWAHFEEKGKKTLISNPLMDNRNSMGKLSIMTGINNSFMLGVVLINDECKLNPISNVKGEPSLLPLSQLRQYIKKMESSDLPSFVPGQLKNIIKDLHDLKCQTDRNHPIDGES